MLKTAAGDIIGTQSPLVRFADLKARKIVNNRATLANWISSEGFPPGRMLGPNTRAWTEQEINDWLAARPLGADLQHGGRVMTRTIKTTDFVWRGVCLHLGRRATPILTLVADATYPHLYRVQYPDGWLSPPANLTRAKDAAYGHARYLLAEETPPGRAHSPESREAA